jgi:hypothetical protein
MCGANGGTASAGQSSGNNTSSPERSRARWSGSVRAHSLHHTLEVRPAGEQPGGVDVSGERPSRMSRRARTRVLAWAADVEVDPMVGGVVRFVDSGFWRGA